MNSVEVIDIAHDGLWTLIIVSAPIMMIALIIGLMVSLFQALTQVQEMTLTFVPKILAVFISLMVFMPFMLETLEVFTEELFTRITVIGENDRELR